MAGKEYGGVILNPGCCNYCVFCGNVQNVPASDLRQQEVKVAKNLVDLKNEGVRKIEISGSDPIEYDKICSLIRYMKRVGFEYVQLSTHGNRLSDESFVKEIIASGLDQLRIPLYGSNASVHDSVTRTNGSFEAVLKGIKTIMKESPSIRVQISSLITQQNKNDLISLVELVRSLGIVDFYFSIPCVSNEDYSYYVPFKDLGRYVRKVYDYSFGTNYKVMFKEIPFCVFGKADRSFIDNSIQPPNLGKYCQPPENFQTAIKDLPSYRVKKKITMCEECTCSSFCDGFFINDVNKFGAGSLKPVNAIREKPTKAK